MSVDEESLGKRLGRITRDVREAKRIEEERAEAARLKAEREMLIRARGLDLFNRCSEEALQAAHEGLDTVISRLPIASADELLHLAIAEYVVAELIRSECRAELLSTALGDTTEFFRVQIGWDVPPVEHQEDPIEEMVVAPVPPSPWPREAHAIGAVALKRVALVEKHPCDKCSAKHAESGLGEKFLCECTCHLFSNPRLAPVRT